MKRHLSSALFIGICLLMTACAVGKKVPYHTMNVNLAYRGTSSLGLCILDNREMILDGSQKPSFVGYTRSSVGIAYPMTTSDGQPFREDLAKVITKSLTNSGFTVQEVLSDPANFQASLQNWKKEGPGEKFVVLNFNKLHTDYYTFTDFIQDVVLEVYAKDGTLLISKNFAKTERIGKGSFWGTGKYQEYSPKYLQAQIEGWFNEEDVKTALD